MKQPQPPTTASEVTLREDVSPSPTTTAGSEATLIETAASTGPATVTLTAGFQIDGWRLREAIKVTSGEADLWIATGKDSQTAVVKVFRWGLRPKAEIEANLSKVSKEQVVDVYGRGVLPDGRHYEILEHIRHGTLADLGKGGLPPARVNEVLKELADAVQALHEAGILHRDLKPSNVLVRTVEPLDLVLTDFGISSLAELSLHATSAHRTAAYSAPEAMTGVVSRASDWWSVGVMVLELLRASHPFAGLDERAVNFQLVTRGIEVPPDLALDWAPLVKGLLTRDHAKRWGAEQVRGWLEGKRNLTVHYTMAAAAVIGQKPYRFEGQEYGDAAGLAAALAEHWEEGVKHWGRGYVLQWIEKQLEDQDLANRLHDVQDDKGLPTPELQLATAVLVMNSELPLSYKGELVTPDWLRVNWGAAREVLGSQLPQWLQRLRAQAWLEESARQWKVGINCAEQSGVAFDREGAERLLASGDRAVADELIAERRRQYTKGRKHALTTLLQKERLDLPEAVLLATADPKEFFTAEQLLVHESLAWLDKQKVPYDRARATRLVLARDWEKVTPLVQKRRTEYAAARSALLTNLLQDKPIEYLEAVLFVCAKPDQFLDAKDHQCQQELEKIRSLNLTMYEGWEDQATELLARRDWSQLPSKEDLDALAHLSKSPDLRAIAGKPMEFWQGVALNFEVTRLMGRLRFNLVGGVIAALFILAMGLICAASGKKGAFTFWLGGAMVVGAGRWLFFLFDRHSKLKTAGWTRLEFVLHPKSKELVVGGSVIPLAEAANSLGFSLLPAGAFITKCKMLINGVEYVCRLDLTGGESGVMKYLEGAGILVPGSTPRAETTKVAHMRIWAKRLLLAGVVSGVLAVVVPLTVSVLLHTDPDRNNALYVLMCVLAGGAGLFLLSAACLGVWYAILSSRSGEKKPSSNPNLTDSRTIPVPGAEVPRSRLGQMASVMGEVRFAGTHVPESAHVDVYLNGTHIGRGGLGLGFSFQFTTAIGVHHLALQILRPGGAAGPTQCQVSFPCGGQFVIELSYNPMLGTFDNYTVHQLERDEHSSD